MSYAMDLDQEEMEESKRLANKVNFILPFFHQIAEVQVIPYNLSRKVPDGWQSNHLCLL